VTVIAPKLRQHRAAALAALVAANPLGAGARIYDGQAPEGTVETPYGVVHGYPTNEFDGPVSDPHADVKALVQASFHGATADEAEGLADACVPILLDRTKYTIAGRYVDQPELRTYRGATKDPDTSIDRYSAHLIVAIPTTPA
jgi:hypothetical protein